MELRELYAAFQNLVGGGEMLDSVHRILFSAEKDTLLSGYCVMNLGVINTQEYDRLKRAYDEMRSQMQTAATAKRYTSQEVL